MLSSWTLKLQEVCPHEKAYCRCAHCSERLEITVRAHVQVIKMLSGYSAQVDPKKRASGLAVWGRDQAMYASAKASDNTLSMPNDAVIRARANLW